jgi:tetratricopeptide (TPR) repeat protein
MFRSRVIVVLTSILVFVVGCAASQKALKQKPQGARDIVLEPTVIGIQPDQELGLTEFDAATLFREGIRLHEAAQCDRALPFYRRLIQDFPESRYLSAAAFNAGRCLEEMGQAEEAVGMYRRITEHLIESKDWIDSAFRESGCLTKLSRHREAAQLLLRLVERPEIGLPDKIDAMVLHAEALLAQGELLVAERQLRASLRLYKERERLEYLDPAPAARAEFRLAELAAKRFLASPLRLPESQMEEDLEAKAAVLLEAQAAFLRSMRYGDPEWATASGYRIGTLYLDLYQALEQAPVPSDLSEEEIRVYQDLLRQRLGVLLRKALKVFEMTLSIGERTRSDNDWTHWAREAMERVEKLVLSQLPEKMENP